MRTTYPEAKQVPTSEGSLSYTDNACPSGPVIVLLHGNSMCKEMFQHQVEYFTDKKNPGDCV